MFEFVLKMLNYSLRKPYFVINGLFFALLFSPIKCPVNIFHIFLVLQRRFSALFK